MKFFRRLPAGLLFVAACASHPIVTGDEARVQRVYDGDTIEVEYHGRTERLRYIGIDTPEMNDPRPEIRELAREAAAANRALVAGRVVTLEFDVQERDRYGRLLAYVRTGDTLVNERLVRDGYARAGSYPPNVRHQQRLRAAQRAARGDGRRLWDGRLPDGEPLRLPQRAAADAADAADAAVDGGAVCDSVAGSRRLPGAGGLTFLNLGRDYPDQRLTVVIGARDRENFPASPERAYAGRRICVTGDRETYRGRLQIRVRSPAQIVVQNGNRGTP